MINLIISLIVVVIVSVVHAICLSLWLAHNMGDWIPFFKLTLIFNIIFYAIVDWMTEYIRKDIEN